MDHRPEFGFNFDPSHLLWQFVDPVQFIRAFPDRIYHVHVKDAARTLDGKTGILASHLNFGDPRRGWDFRSPGRGQVDFEEIARALNQIGYDGPLSVEWEDCGHGPRVRRRRGRPVRQVEDGLHLLRPRLRHRLRRRPGQEVTVVEPRRSAAWDRLTARRAFGQMIVRAQRPSIAADDAPSSNRPEEARHP